MLFAESIASLESLKNEPLNWLMGAALRQHAKLAVRPHFLLDALKEQRTGTLIYWNATISAFRDLLTNPEPAPQKVCADLQSIKKHTQDAEEKLRAIAAEVQAPIALERLGFRQFSVVMPGVVPRPDFEAEINGQRALIEVKNLREPQDILRNIASDQWNKRKNINPSRYSFNVILKHSHRGSMSETAERRLRTIIDQIPSSTKPFEETLDGNIHVRLERLDLEERIGPDSHIFASMIKGRPKGRLIVSNPISANDFGFNISDVQSLFLKAVRPIVGSNDKFFGKLFDQETLNVVALRWEPPDLFVDPELMRHVEDRIQQLYGDFGLNLRIVIFTDPEMPWELFHKYE